MEIDIHVVAPNGIDTKNYTIRIEVSTKELS